MPHVVILAHRRTPLEARRYFLREIADVWRESGVRVTVLRGPGPLVDADAAVLHVDLTVVPEDHLDFVRQYPVALNARVVDISKRRISANLVRRGDGYEGLVIVKTDANCGGVAEDLVARRGPRATRLVRSVRNALPWSFRARIPTSDYPILDSPDDVPAAVWMNPDLVVERFLPERDGGRYCLRTWVFLGDRETHSLSWSDDPVIKASNVIRRDPLGEVPEELRRMRTEMGFDFGKFDYAVADGRVVVYDVNRTPTVNGAEPEQYMPRIRLLAEGLRKFL